MNDPLRPTHADVSAASPSRRKFLFGAGAAATAIGAGGVLLRSQDERWPSADAGSTTPDAPTTAAKPLPALASVPEGRTLVVINLEGGNDGLATLEPLDSARLRGLRDNLLHEPADLVPIDEEMGLNPSLAGLHQQGLAIVEGVGIPGGDLSHFEMTKRWATGARAQDDRYYTGFLGRLCDQLDEGAPLTGLAIGGHGHSPALLSQKAATATLGDPDAGWYFRDEDPWLRQFRSSISTMSPLTSGSVSTASGSLLATAHQGILRALDLADMLDDFDIETPGVEYPGGELSDSLAAAAKLVRSNTGVRILQLTLSGFDTHDDQPGTHDYLMMQLNDALTAFRNDLATDGLDRSTLIATTSEFGRRPRSSGSGTDHGNASVALLAGPVAPGRHGEAASLTALDTDDNLAPTVTLSEYYATLAGWFGIDPGLVLPDAPTPLSGLLT